MTRLSSSEPLNFACSRRALPAKLFAIAGALLLPDRQSKILDIPTETQPKFKIGDLIAADWIDEFDNSVTDFGEVLGVRYIRKAQSCFPENSWIYYINWTHSTCGMDWCYPCYDNEGSRECDLRLVS